MSQQAIFFSIWTSSSLIQNEMVKWQWSCASNGSSFLVALAVALERLILSRCREHLLDRCLVIPKSDHSRDGNALSMIAGLSHNPRRAFPIPGSNIKFKARTPTSPVFLTNLVEFSLRTPVRMRSINQ